MLVRIRKGRNQRPAAKLHDGSPAVLYRQRIAHIHNAAPVLNQILKDIVICVDGDDRSVIDGHVKTSRRIFFFLRLSQAYILMAKSPPAPPECRNRMLSVSAKASSFASSSKPANAFPV